MSDTNGEGELRINTYEVALHESREGLAHKYTNAVFKLRAVNSKKESLERQVKALEAENKNLNDRISHFMFFCSSDQRKYFMDTWDDFSYEQSLSELQAKAIEEFGATFAGVYPDWSQKTKTFEQYAIEYAASKRSSDK